MMRRTSLAMVMMALVSAAACGDDKKTSSDDDVRAVTGLGKSSVAIKGYYYFAGLLGYDGDYPAGQKMENAIRQAIDEINTQGGVHGHSVGLILCNTSGDPVVTQECLDDVIKVPYVTSIIGPMRSVELLGIAASVKTDKIVVMSPSATAPTITALDDDGYVNRDAASDAFQGKVTARLAYNIGGYRKVFVANYDDPYGNGLESVFSTEFAALGGTVTHYTFTSTQDNFAQTTATQAAAAQPDAIYLAGFIDPLVAVTNALDSVNFTTPPKFVTCDLLTDSSFIGRVNTVGKMSGAIGVTPAPATGPVYNTYEANYQRLWGTPDEAYVPNAYDAVYLLSLAMQVAADPDDRTQVRDGLAKTHSGTSFDAADWAKGLELATANGEANYNGASGEVDLDANGEVSINYNQYTFNGTTVSTVGCRTPEGAVCP